jgi:hypothetical protein
VPVLFFSSIWQLLDYVDILTVDASTDTGGAVLKIVVSFIRCRYYEYYLYFKQNVATTA